MNVEISVENLKNYHIKEHCVLFVYFSIDEIAIFYIYSGKFLVFRNYWN